MIVDPGYFFASVRHDLFGGFLRQGQVDGMNVILDEFERRNVTTRDSDVPLRKLAYEFATTFHETGRKMWPIHEDGGPEYFRRLYDITGDYPARARRYGNVNPGDGIKYHGRGFVQLTWSINYMTMGDILGIDLINKPDLALEPEIAVKIMFEGMERGLFTGHKLNEYFDTDKDDPVGARYIINGTDHCFEIAGYHEKFLNGLTGGKLNA